MHEQFWQLTDPGSQSSLAEWDDGMDFERITCSLKPGHQRPGKRFGELRVILPNRPVQDFVWTWISDCLIQDHVLELFKQNSLTGYMVKPVKARFKRSGSPAPPRLWEVVVTGWGGMASADSGVRLLESCPGCGHLRYSAETPGSKIIDPAQWDGSDFFIVWPYPRFILISDRVAQLIRDNRIEGAQLQRFEENRKPRVGDGLSPGRLSYWFPLERAKEIGRPLGII